MRLTLDHHYPKIIVPALRDRGHDVVAAFERSWHQTDDGILLALCTADRRGLLTNNVAHFSIIAADWTAEARTHHGLIFTSDRTFPRREEDAGPSIAALDTFLGAHPEDTALVDLIVWL